MSFTEGTSFFIGGDRHLWFVLSDPQKDAEQVLYVNITSFDPSSRETDARNDRACLVHPGEHSFVQHISCVYYAGAHVARVDGIGGSSRISLHRDRASPSLLIKMRQGAVDSMHMLPDFREILVDQGLV